MFTRKLLATSLLAGILAAQAAGAAEISNLDNLPDKGTVNLSGIVDSIDGKRSLTLRDELGHTIDVKAKNDLQVSAGDRVEISGMVGSDFLGMGREISSATVVRTAAADTTSRPGGNAGANSNPVSKGSEGSTGDKHY